MKFLEHYAPVVRRMVNNSWDEPPMSRDEAEKILIHRLCEKVASKVRNSPERLAKE